MVYMGCRIMAILRSRPEYGLRFRRKYFFKTTLTAFFTLILVLLAVLLVINWRSRLGNERKEIQGFWEQGAYDRTFALTGEALKAEPMDYFLLVMHGFASYQIAMAQINNFDTLSYIDGCIRVLRKALLFREGLTDGRVCYVLGKAYHYKGPSYADLSVEYLVKARRLSYEGRDIPQYLGLAYADLRDYRNSVAAFTLALSPQDTGPDISSDLLLLSIARSYAELDENEPAKAYLFRCLENSRDANTVAAARLLLGNILGKTGDRAGAAAQYLAIIESGAENAEAHYRLGEVYFQQKDEIQARAQWRNALRINPAHSGARARFNM